MPKPEAVMNGFQDLIDMIKRKEANGWREYEANKDWYRENQIRALGVLRVKDEFHE